MTRTRLRAGLVTGALTLVTAVGAAAPAAVPVAAAAPSAAAAPVLAARAAAPPVQVLDPDAGYPRQEPLAVVPDDPADASLARGATPYDDIAPRINALLAGSERISAEVVGRSTLGRDIHLVTITGPETPAENAQQSSWREKLLRDPEGAAADEALQAGYKTPIWFNSNIHGNEWEGTDASLNYIEDLVAAPDAEVQQLLGEHRLYFTLTINPDGRFAGQRATGLQLDANRDFITSTTPETRVIRDLVDEIQPTFFVDLHGYTGVLQVEPCGPPHGESYDYDLFLPHAYAAALKVEADVLAADIQGDPDEVAIPYRDIPSGWDDFPPVFTAQYVAFHGAIASTTELPLGRVADPATNQSNSRIDTAVAEEVIASNVEYVLANADALLDNQIEIFRRGAAGEPIEPIAAPTTPAERAALGAAVPGPDEWVAEWGPEDVPPTTELPRAFVLPVGPRQASQSDADRLAQHLIDHNVRVSRATADFTVRGQSYPAGSYVIDMHQPLRGLANALLGEGSDISALVPEMYDISGWSEGLLWGATVLAAGDTVTPTLPVQTVPVTSVEPLSTMPARGGYLSFDVAGLAEVRAANALLADGVALTRLPGGAVVAAPDDYDAVALAAKEFGLDVVSTTGQGLTGADARPLAALKVGYTVPATYVGGGEDLLALQEMGFVAPVPVSAARLQADPALLDDVDVLWVGPALSINATTQRAAQLAVLRYVDQGKGVVGRGTAANAFANAYGLLSSTATSARGDANGVITVETTEDGVLADTARPQAFAYPPVYFTPGAGATVEQTYADDPLVAGHWLPTEVDEGRPPVADGPADFAGKASVVSGASASGARALVFGTSPTFRTHPKGMFGDVAAALLWAGPEGEPLTGSAFSDVPAGDTFYAEVRTAAERGYVLGYPDGTFRPGDPVSRNQVAAIVYRLAAPAGYAPPTRPTFLDVPTAAAGYAGIEYLASEGVIQGYETPAGREFRPDARITRAQVAALLARYAGEELGAPTEAPFSDVPVGAQFAAEIGYLADLGVALGSDDGNGGRAYRPGESLGRGQLAALVVRFDDLVPA